MLIHFNISQLAKNCSVDVLRDLFHIYYSVTRLAFSLTYRIVCGFYYTSYFIICTNCDVC